MGEPRGGQGAQGLVGVLRQPGSVTELDGDCAAREPPGDRGEIVEPVGVEVNPRRQLEQDVAELAGLGDRPDRVSKEAKRPIEGLRRKAGRVDLAAARARGVPRQQRGEIGRDGLRSRMVAGQQRVRLDVKDEPRWRALDPPNRVPHVGDRVVRAVHLHDVEHARVVAEPGLRAHRLLRIERPALDERRIGPRANPDPDRLGQI